MEHFFICPYCWQTVSMVLDCYEEESSYVEDCEVCCRPVDITFRFEEEELVYFSARRIDGIA